MSPNSTITIYKDRIYLTGQPREGQPTNIQIFNREDLKLITTIDSNRLDEAAREQQ
ncbi:MAG: hypothetical protein KDK30_17715 [Leptospiraceae bacterium]|nr:hypothetical protein [Leptospiraceae bacterium]